MTEQKRGGFSLQWQMLVGFLIGLIAGLVVYATQADADWVKFVTTYVTQPIGQIFLRLLFMLVYLCLSRRWLSAFPRWERSVHLSAWPSNPRLYRYRLGDRGAVSLAAVNVLKPGAGVDRAAAATMLEQSAGRAGEIIKSGAEQPSGIDAFVSIVPNNLVEVMGSNSAILSVMFFALFFGIGLLLTDTPNSRVLQRGFEYGSTSRCGSAYRIKWR